MEQIIRHFRDVAIALVVSVAMLTIIFAGIKDNSGNVGFLNMIGPAANFTEFNYRDFTDFKKVIAEAQKELPQVTYDLGQPGIKAGHDIYLPNYVKATDRNGASLSIKVKKIIKNQEVVTDIYSKDTQIVNFPDSGVYTVYISVSDDTNRIQNKKIEIPVNRSL